MEISAKPPRASSSLMGSLVWEGNGLMLVRLASVLGFVGVFGGVWILAGLWCSCPHCRDACGLLLSSPMGPMPGFFSGPLYLERLLLHTHERGWTFPLGSQADCPGFPPAPPCVRRASVWEALSVISGLVPWPLCCPLTHCILGRAGC